LVLILFIFKRPVVLMTMNIIIKVWRLVNPHTYA